MGIEASAPISESEFSTKKRKVPTDEAGPSASQARIGETNSTVPDPNPIDRTDQNDTQGEERVQQIQEKFQELAGLLANFHFANNLRPQ